MIPLWLIAVLCVLAGMPLAYLFLMPVLRGEFDAVWKAEHEFDEYPVEMSARLKFKIGLICHTLCIAWPLAAVIYLLLAVRSLYETLPGVPPRQPFSRTA